jgi:hypothetical protein
MGIEVFASPVASMAGNATTDLQNLLISLVEVCEHESHPANRNWYIAASRVLEPVMTVVSDAHSYARLISLPPRLIPDSVDLREKHPALLVINYRFALICQIPPWWCYQRVGGECLAMYPFLFDQPHIR